MALVSSLALSHFTKWKVNIQANLVIYYTIHIAKPHYLLDRSISTRPVSEILLAMSQVQSYVVGKIWIFENF